MEFLIDKNMNKTVLRDAIGITSVTLVRFSKNQNAKMDARGKKMKRIAA